MPTIDIHALPAAGLIRQSQLIGCPPVTTERAEANRRKNAEAAAKAEHDKPKKKKLPEQPCPGTVGILPISSATLWRMVVEERFPRPIKVSERVTAWRCEDVHAWIKAREEASAKVRRASSKRTVRAAVAA